MGESLQPGYHLDIEAELQLVEKVKTELTASKSSSSDKSLEKTAMKELGLKRSDHSTCAISFILIIYMMFWTSGCYATCNYIRAILVKGIAANNFIEKSDIPFSHDQFFMC